MITKEMIEKARKERERSLEISSLIIMLGGLFFSGYSLCEMLFNDGFNNIAFHILFMFGGLLTCFGIFVGEKK